MATHIGLLLFKGIGQTLFEKALEYYAKDVIRRGNTYLATHINEICTKDEPTLQDSYASRVQGFCTIEDAYHKVQNSNTEIAVKIKEKIVKMHEDGEFMVLEEVEEVEEVEELIVPKGDVDVDTAVKEDPLLNDVIETLKEEIELTDTPSLEEVTEEATPKLVITVEPVETETEKTETGNVDNEITDNEDNVDNVDNVDVEVAGWCTIS